MRLRLLPRYALLIVSLTMSIMAVLGAALYFQFRVVIGEVRESAGGELRSALLGQIEERGEGLVVYLSSTLTNPLYRNDMQTIGLSLRAAGDQQGVAFAQVFDPSGMVLSDDTPTFESYGRMLDRPLVRRVLDDGATDFEIVGNELQVAARIAIGSRVLGGVIVGLSMERYETGVAGMQQTLDRLVRDAVTRGWKQTAIVGGTLLLAALLLSLIVAGGLARPIGELSRLAARIGSGETGVDVPVRRKDELGDLATAMRDMAADLRRTTVSRDYLDSILENMLDPLLVLGADGRVTTANAAAGHTLGYDRNELLGRPVGDLLRAADGKLPDLPADAAKGSRAGVGHEVTLMTRDGRHIPALASWAPMTGGDGTAASSLLVARDITERKRAEVELRAAKEQSEEANRSKSEFLANMSHELRTPLNAILGFSEVMSQEILGPLGNAQYRGYAGDIHFSGEHLLRIVNDLLDLAKIEAGRLQLHEEAVDLGELAVTVRRIVTERAEGAGIRIELTGGAPSLLWADRRLVLQALLNLVSNSIKFTQAGGRVTIDTGAEAGGGLFIAVRDTGWGMSEEDIAKTQVPFGLSDGTVRQHGAGAGLGLPITRSFAKMHGGGVEIVSRPGEGTQATIRFPPDRTLARKVQTAIS